jgi:hypothetical protein
MTTHLCHIRDISRTVLKSRKRIGWPKDKRELHAINQSPMSLVVFPILRTVIQDVNYGDALRLQTMTMEDISAGITDGRPT